jgi:NAD(P) transhydrogenase subunit alpha
MKIAIPRERRANETRVAISPEAVKKFVALGCEVAIEKNAGAGAAYTDAAFKAAGAAIAKDAAAACKGAAVILKVRRPEPAELDAMPAGAVLVAMLDPHRAGPHGAGPQPAGGELQAIAGAGLAAFAMELMPRITRAQSMDVLSSQANLAGYKAVLDAAGEYGRIYPMLMTAAGRINPAQVMVMGVGVAGLQAIATARRLGAVVHATDVRPAAKEQVESLGGKFVAVEDEEFKQAETAAGYAKEMSGDYQKKQAALIAETLPKMNVVITTAAIPGRPAPKLISAAMVKSMKTGSVIVDLAVETGGNCELTEAGKVVVKHGVKIVGHLNVPGRLAADASMLYANNLFNFVSLLYDKESKELAIDWEDEIVQGTLVTRDGAVVHPDLKPSGAAPAPAAKAEPEGVPEDTPEDAAEEAESDG